MQTHLVRTFRHAHAETLMRCPGIPIRGGYAIGSEARMTEPFPFSDDDPPIEDASIDKPVATDVPHGKILDDSGGPVEDVTRVSGWPDPGFEDVAFPDTGAGGGSPLDPVEGA